MNRKLVSGILFFAIMMMFGHKNAESRQNTAPAKPSPGFKTATKVIKVQLKLSDGSSFTVLGRATFTVVQANEDDSMIGDLVYELPVEARNKIAQTASISLDKVSANISLKNLTANFKQGSTCPQIKLLVAAKNVELRGAQLVFDRVVLNINETPEQINQLFCSLTRQINVKRQRKGLIAAINRLLTSPDATDEAVENKPLKP